MFKLDGGRPACTHKRRNGKPAKVLPKPTTATKSDDGGGSQAISQDTVTTSQDTKTIKPFKPPRPRPRKDDGGFFDGLLNVLQTGLEFVGMIPVIGEPFDIVNAGISAARGD